LNNAKSVVPILDVDGNGKSDGLTDGIIIQRYLMGVTGSSLIQNALGAGATRDAGQIFAFLSAHRSQYDVDASGTVDPLTDGVLITRYLMGATGRSLTGEVCELGLSPACPLGKTCQACLCAPWASSSSRSSSAYSSSSFRSSSTSSASSRSSALGACRYDDANGKTVGSVFITQAACYTYWDAFGASRPGSKVYFNNMLIRIYVSSSSSISSRSSSRSSNPYSSSSTNSRSSAMSFSSSSPLRCESGYTCDHQYRPGNNGMVCAWNGYPPAGCRQEISPTNPSCGTPDCKGVCVRFICPTR
jgi:hypothetical protein